MDRFKIKFCTRAVIIIVAVLVIRLVSGDQLSPSVYGVEDHQHKTKATELFQYNVTTNLSYEPKTHKIYDLKIDIPKSWKIQSGFDHNTDQRKGALLAVDDNKKLTYPRNIEVKVIPDSLYINTGAIKDLKEFIKRRVLSSHRGLSVYNYDQSDTIKLNDRINAIIIYASFSLNDSELRRIHLAIPYGRYYFLITYTDLRALLVSNESPSFEVFWSVVSSIDLPKRAVFAGNIQSIIVLLSIFIAIVMLIILIVTLSRFIASYRIQTFDAHAEKLAEQEYEKKIVMLKRAEDIKLKKVMEKKLEKRRRDRAKMIKKQSLNDTSTKVQQSVEEFAVSEDERLISEQHDDSQQDQTFMA